MVTKVVTVVKTKKGPHTHKKKGELMENDQDAMEVSFFIFPHIIIKKCVMKHISFTGNVFFL